MNIAILCNQDLASCLALNYLLPRLKTHHLGLFLSSQVGENREVPEALQMLKFFEQSLFNEMLFPLLDNRSSTTNANLQSFTHLSIAYQSPLTQLNHINTDEGLSLISAFKPELIISIRFGKILKAPVITLPKLGVLNLHSGILPDYQGVMATFWAMFNQEKEYGSTLHFINSAAIDAGPIITINKHQLDLSSSYLDNVLALYKDGCRSILDTVKLLESGGSPTTREQSGQAKYYSFPAQKELAEFHSLGMRLYSPESILAISRRFTSKL